MKRICLWLGLLALAGCGSHERAPIAIVDTDRIVANWPQFQNYQNQLSASMAAIDRSRASEPEKNKARVALQSRYSQFEGELVNELTRAASQIANQQHYSLILTKQSVGFGGTDITGDVEKALHITEVSPSPGK